MEMLLFLQSHPLVAYGFIALIALCVGSFLNVVIYRLPIMLQHAWQQECNVVLGLALQEKPMTQTQPILSLSFPRSHCTHCRTPLSLWQNIPFFSYCWLKGRCATCRQRISLRYPFVEIITTLLSVFVIYHFGFTITGMAAMLLTWMLIAATVIDLEHQLLPDTLTLPLLWLGLIINIPALFASTPSAIMGAAIGYISLWGFTRLFFYTTGKIGMGYGDFKLFAALGAWLGWQRLPLILLLAAMLGTVIGISFILIKKRDRRSPIPFGPFLAIAGFIALLWGDNIMQVYLHFSGFSV